MDFRGVSMVFGCFWMVFNGFWLVFNGFSMDFHGFLVDFLGFSGCRALPGALGSSLGARQQGALRHLGGLGQAEAPEIDGFPWVLR